MTKIAKDIVDTRQLKDREFLRGFFDHTDRAAQKVKRGEVQRHHEGKIVASLFYEPSTRTKMSFDAAAKRLGADVIGTENARQFSSAYKGETLEHSLLAVEDCFDAVVIRHPESGAAKRGAAVLKKPLINAGDGTNQHPTQALLDLYTIRDLFGQVDDLRIAFVGDIAHGRTVRSLTYLLAHLQGNRLYFVSPPELGLTDEMRQYLQERGVTFSDHEDVDEVIGKVDVLYVTRLQWERVEDEDRRQHLISDYKRHQITWERADRMKGGSVLMHPLPINTERSNGYPEIASEVDYHPRAHYFRQSNNGLYVRMALLDILLRPERELCNLILDVT